MIITNYSTITFCGVVYVLPLTIVTKYLPVGILEISILYFSFLEILPILSL